MRSILFFIITVCSACRISHNENKQDFILSIKSYPILLIKHDIKKREIPHIFVRKKLDNYSENIAYEFTYYTHENLPTPTFLVILISILYQCPKSLLFIFIKSLKCFKGKYDLKISINTTTKLV